MRTRNIILLLSSLLFVLIYTSCKPSAKTEKIITMTIEPQRYFASLIGGENFEYKVMIPDGQNPETYDPTPQDIIKASQSIAYLRIGPIAFETMWMDAIQANQPDMKVFDLSENASFIQEEHLHAHDHDHAHHHEHTDGEEAQHHHHSHAGGIDPHIWTSFEGARVICQNIMEAFIQLDSDNEDLYRINYKKAINEINDTQKEAERILKESNTRTFAIYHPSLSYLAREMKLEQLSIERDGKEPSPLQLKELIEEAQSKQVNVVFIQQEFDKKNAEIVARDLNCPVVSINPLAYDWKEEILHIVKALSKHE